MVEQVDVPVPEDMEQIIDMPVLSNGRWVTGTGGDAEYVKTLTSSVALLKRKVDLAVMTDSQDTTSERDGRARDVVEVRGAVEPMPDWVTEVESVATQPFEIVEVIQLVPQERVQERIVEETIDVPVPQGMKEIVEAWKYIPQEHVQNCTREHAVDVPVRVIKMNLAKKHLEMLAEIAEEKDDCEKSYEEFVKCMKLEIRENSVDDFEVAELLRFNTSKSGD